MTPGAPGAHAGAPPWHAQAGDRPFRRVAAGLVAAVAVLPLSLLPVVGLGSGPAAAASTVEVAVTTQTPAIGRSGSTLQLAGTVTNGGSQVLREVSVRLRMSQTGLGSRSELQAVMAGQVTSRDGQVVAEVTLPDLGPGAVAPFDLRQALDRVPELTGFGVYALGVEVVGRRGQKAAGRVALARSLLPWAPSTPAVTPTGFSWVWPLVAEPVRLADGTFATDRLARELAPGGRLDRLLQAGIRLDQGAALTWAIDPELVETVQDMAGGDGYRVVADGGRNTVPGGGAGLAQVWLEQLQAATSGAPVLPLPYADPDVVALVRHGAPGDVARARRAAAEVLATALPGADVSSELAWPADGYLDRNTLAALARTGVTGVVLDGRALPPTIDLSYTPSGRARIPSAAGPVAGLLADPGLADLLAAAPTPAATAPPVLAAQRVVAETAMIAAELPSGGTDRTIVAMPPRRWDPSQGYLDQLVAQTQAPWAAPVSLREMAGDTPPEVDRTRLRYPGRERRAELPEASLRAMDTFRSGIATLAGILTDRTRLVPGLQASHLRLTSTYWRGRSEARARRFFREQDYLSELRKSVRVQPGDFTFGSKTGNIPVTLVNDLDQPVDVALRLEPQTPRLRLQAVEVPEIGANQKIQVEVPATALAGGLVVVEADLRTPGGAPFAPPVALRVRVTEIGTVALVITIGAAVVLFIAAGVRVVRRLRRRDPDDPTPEPVDDTADVSA